MRRTTKGWTIVFTVLALATAGRAGVEAQIAIGVKGGVSASTVAWRPSPLDDGLEDVTRRRAFSGGLMLTAGLPGPLRLRTEVLRTGKGFTETQSNGDVTRLLVDYVETPVLLGLIGRRGPLEPEVYAGPWMSREIRCDAEAEALSTRLSFDCDEVPNDPVLRRKTDFGVAAGVSLGISGMGPLTGLVDARYTAGLRNVDDQPAVENIHAKHRSSSLTLGILLTL